MPALTPTLRVKLPIDAYAGIGPGKFHSRADRRVYLQSLDGGCDIISWGEYSGESSTLVEGRILGIAKAGAIMHEDSQGFVTVEYFDDAAKLANEWARLQALAPCECDCDDCDTCHPVTLDVWRVSFAAYTGCSPLPTDYETEDEARRAVYALLIRRGDAGHPVEQLTNDGDTPAQWEIGEPADCMLVPDTAGVLTLSHVVERA